MPRDLPAQVVELPSVEPNFGTIHSYPCSYPVGSKHFTTPSSEVSNFFPWWIHVNIEQYLFSLQEINQKWERDLPLKLKEHTFPSSSSTNAHQPSLVELVESFQMMVEECGLLDWALQKFCSVGEAKQAKFERAIHFNQ
ncbi:hypothetical protein PVK06_042859 [Gossypium arboreum]|uniref:Uncharacterized protein n=1 Tax=Gossypium arboreum TaxID=29729 RepID=A0ABR0MMD2_GOSAR|nr:hypothetical protein PVK06_042859 [Gossypium arboreum]